MADKKYTYSPVEIYRGIEIKRHPKVFIRVSVSEMKKLIDARLDMGMSAREAIASTNIICKKCLPSAITPSLFKP